MQDQPVGSRESHPRDTLTAGEDLQTKVSAKVDLLSIQSSLKNIPSLIQNRGTAASVPAAKERGICLLMGRLLSKQVCGGKLCLAVDGDRQIFLRNARSARVASFGAISIMVAKSPLLA